MYAPRSSSPRSLTLASARRRVASPVRTAVALGLAVERELTWGLRNAAREAARWRVLAARIPDAALRADALEAIDHKRANIDGAVLFTTLARRRSADLLRLLVAFEILADYLDCTSERGAYIGLHNGLQLHRALIDAVSTDSCLDFSSYYRSHPWKDDGGFVRALTHTCRQAYVRLPSYAVVHPFVTRAANLTQVLALNHEEDPRCRDALLRNWASTHLSHAEGLTSFERTGAASAWLTILALLALAADERRTALEAHATFRAYLPWISLTGTLLDSYCDADADASNGAHSYVAHYSTPDASTKRIGEVIQRSLAEASSLPRASRHRVLVSAMAAMYLSKNSVRIAALRAHTRELIRAAGPLTQLLVPVLRVWRILSDNNQRAT